MRAHQELGVRGGSAAERTSVTFFSGTSSAPVAARRCSMVCCSSCCSSFAPSAGDGRFGGALGEQQVEILVEAADGLVQLLDGGVRDEVAPHALERRREQRVGEGEVLVLAIARLGRPAHDREDRQQLLRLIAQRAQVHRQVAGEQAQLPGAARGAPRPSSASSTMFIRSGPVMVSVDHSSSPAAPKMATQEVRGSSERTRRT